MKITVMGIGYVGLAIGLTLAELGHKVIGLDIDKEKVKLLNQGISPIHEENLEKTLKKNLQKKQIFLLRCVLRLLLRLRLFLLL